MFTVIMLPEFKKTIKKVFTRKEIEEIERFISKTLRFKGDKVGDPLRFPFLREKRVEGKRIYYLVYKDLLIILLVDASNKKTQQKTINNIIELLPFYKEQARKYKQLLK